ncbi:helix-turn-helix domain-containing protein [Vibrio europaeus]|uniref:Mor transcription activator family protein n=1 Tax=Vibrio europaeus TaxID=300876 RepID=UPI00233E9453|nr:Mor transcription activator family protein [Vibrio europaeus]MDC5755218.1 helix-turn-helix domain-containing protein [Vibrio europaeus]MDC5775797.1 helix-turn-helix domain-containing protein [Vibrio europaeus]MDC5794935.1 helix-turn-helix domain-containing protein [Vibrio europaeus]MDC5799506.1 helix-turn-helix domain-containing protein [Vibrio europaeus]MDC5817214.1 helix-turn-helix domain-containing protein [Vibrio europaeus]
MSKNVDTELLVQRISEDPTILENLSKIDIGWADELELIHATLAANLAKHSSIPKEMAFITTLEIAETVGGNQFYLPKAEKLKEALRNLLISRDFNGQNYDELAKQYGLSEVSVRRLLKQLKPQHDRLPKPTRLPYEQLAIPNQPKHPWTKNVLEFCNAIQLALQSIGIDSESKAIEVAHTMMRNFGGKQTYIPKGDALKDYLTHLQIYALHNEGMSTRELARMFNKSHKTIYEVLRQVKRDEPCVSH